MSVEGHFKGVDDVKIHTGKSGTCSKGSCKYRDNTTTSGIESKLWQGWEAHHVICVQAVIRYQDLYAETYRSTIDRVYKATDWCINQTPNMKWLPQKETYVAHGSVDESNRRNPVFEGAWELDLPCHDWDHNSKGGYFDELLKDLQAKVWDKIKSARQKKKKPHFGPAKAKAALSNLSKDYKRKLKDRGARKGGTAKAIKNQTVDKWWLPFSMANTAIAGARKIKAWKVPRARASSRGRR